ncbi:MAG: BON domain-containing protein [Bacteroidetes bacterium]|nr:BON domain-containing protein [Bacteroidota bacterium]HET6244081.1 BON domain-containing protein [Bacteroidia bacterium]
MEATDVNAIEKRIKDHLYWHDRVNASDITVEVMDDIVRLSGEVPTYYNKIAAEEDALQLLE